MKPPPINRRPVTVERQLFNATLREEIGHKHPMEIIRTPAETEESTVEETLTDDLHLNEHHAKLLAKKISDRAKEVCKDKTGKEKDDEIEMTITADEEEIKNIMGNQHSRAMDIEKEFKVKIKANRRDPNKIRITGTRDNARRAHEDITNKIRDQRERKGRNTERKQERKHIPCIFFAQKRCIKGDRCHFSHERRTTSTERRRQRSPEQREKRTRSRSPMRDTRTVRIRSVNE